MRHKYEKGFSVIEMLISLSVFLILLSLSPLLFTPQQMKIEKQQFFLQLQSDLYYAQSYAIAHQKKLQVLFDTSNKRYVISINYSNRVLERYYDSKIKVNQDAIPVNFYIGPDGNVSKFDTYLIQIGKKTYRLVFLIGRGRFYVAES